MQTSDGQTGRPAVGRRRLPYLWLPVLVLAGLVAYGFARPSPDAATKPARLGRFSLVSFDGGRISEETLRGHPAVVNLWASWCAPCKREMPLLERVYRKYRSSGLIVLGVNVNDSPSDARSFVRAIGVTYPVARDVSGRLSDRIGLFGLPETAFVKRDGTLLSLPPGSHRTARDGTVWLGELDAKFLEKQIARLLRKEEET
jgi:thiol-disulfide isomerase/thioredoxin